MFLAITLNIWAWRRPRPRAVPRRSRVSTGISPHDDTGITAANDTEPDGAMPASQFVLYVKVHPIPTV